MKNIIRISFSLLLSVITYAQNYQTVEEVDKICSQLGFASDEDAQLAVDRILKQIGLPSKGFKLRNCPNINNAVAKNIKDSNGQYQRYILYDINFMKRISATSSDDWSAISVLAHEIGHHLNGHALNNKGSNHRFELEADYWSGWALGKLGATLEQAQSAIQSLRFEKATSTHPAKKDRLEQIQLGWNDSVKFTKKESRKESDEDLIRKYTNQISKGILYTDIRNKVGIYLNGEYAPYFNRADEGDENSNVKTKYERYINNLNYDTFTISCDFRIEENRQQWIFMLNSSYRLIGYSVNSENEVLLTGNNQSVSINTFKKITHNQWHKATLTYNNGNVKLYLDSELILEDYFEFTEGYPENDKMISMVNWSNGIAFKGFIKNFRVYGRPISNEEVKVLNLMDKI